MYRDAVLRLPCEHCNIEQPTRAMILSPSGAGYLCWPCQLRAQIAEHRLSPIGGPGRLLSLLLVTAIVIGGTCLAAWVIEVLRYLNHPC